MLLKSRAVSLLVSILATAPTFASDTSAVPPASGMIEWRTTLCAVAKVKRQELCKPPEMLGDASTADAVKVRLQRVQFFIEVSEYANALAECDETLKLDPKNVAARHLAARLALSTGDYGRAERELRIALAEASNDMDIQATEAARLEVASTPQLALAKYNSILATKPDHLFSREQRARILYSLNEPKRALDDLNFLIDYGSSKPTVRLLRGMAHLNVGASNEAISDLTEAINISRAPLGALTARAHAYEIIGNDEAALRDYGEILGPVGGQSPYIAIGPRLGKFYIQRAMIFVRTNRLNDAATDAVSAMQVGGKPSILRLQVFLRQNGFPETPLDGISSEQLKTAVEGCFGGKSCFEKISDTL